MHVIQTAESLRKDDSFAGFLQPPWRGECATVGVQVAGVLVEVKERPGSP